MSERAEWMDRYHEFRENIEDGSMCLCGIPALVHDQWESEHWTDDPRTETEYGINCGDPNECCDPWFITDDAGTAYENMQVIREPHALTRTVTTTYGPWRPVDLEAL